MIVGIDPSVRATGWASLRPDKRLAHAELIAAPDLLAATANAWHQAATANAWHQSDLASLGDTYVIELPRIYKTAQQKGDQNDLIAVAAVAGAYACAARAGYAKVRFVYPYEWKRQLPKSVCEQRIRDLLDAEETATLERCLKPVEKKLRNNVIDAVGIALYSAGRFTP